MLYISNYINNGKKLWNSEIIQFKRKIDFRYYKNPLGKFFRKGNDACMIKQAGMDFRHKEVVNINNGKRLGYVQDVCADLGTGRITSIIVPGNKKMINMFSKEEDIVIEWEKIKCIGEDIILVDI